MKLISSEKKGYDYIMTVETKSLCGPPNTFQVRGSCTVWHYYPDGRRCSTLMEGSLCDLWRRLEWEEEDKVKK